MYLKYNPDKKVSTMTHRLEIRNPDDLTFLKYNDPEIDLKKYDIKHPVSYSVSCDLLIKCSNSKPDSRKTWLIPVHKQLLQKTIPYFEGLFREGMDWSVYEKIGSTRVIQAPDGFSGVSVLLFFQIKYLLFDTSLDRSKIEISQSQGWDLYGLSDFWQDQKVKSVVFKCMDVNYLDIRSSKVKLFKPKEVRPSIKLDDTKDVLDKIDQTVLHEIQKGDYYDSENSTKSPMEHKFEQLVTVLRSQCHILPKEIPEEVPEILARLQLLRNYRSKKTIVCTESDDHCLEVSKLLKSNFGKEFQFFYINKNVDNPTKDIILHQFSTGQVKLLITTPNAVPNVNFLNAEFLVNLEMPRNSIDYVGRMSQISVTWPIKRKVITLLSFLDELTNDQLELLLGLNKRRLLTSEYGSALFIHLKPALKHIPGSTSSTTSFTTSSNTSSSNSATDMAMAIAQSYENQSISSNESYYVPQIFH